MARTDFLQPAGDTNGSKLHLRRNKFLIVSPSSKDLRSVGDSLEIRAGGPGWVPAVQILSIERISPVPPHDAAPPEPPEYVGGRFFCRVA